LLLSLEVIHALSSTYKNTDKMPLRQPIFLQRLCANVTTIANIFMENSDNVCVLADFTGTIEEGRGWGMQPPLQEETAAPGAPP
jgi:hypothetical protein